MENLQDSTPKTKEEIFLWIDNLRDSGITNMFGATPYIQERFSLTYPDARDILVEWMETYATRHTYLSGGQDNE